MTYFCPFCCIARGETPADVRYEDDDLIVFTDRSPRAPVHLLIAPRRHIVSLNDAVDPALLGRLLQVAVHMAATEGIDGTGYRTLINTGPNAYQSVPHIHVHLLGGAPLTIDRAQEESR